MHCSREADPLEGGPHAGSGVCRVREGDQRRARAGLLARFGPEARILAGGHSLIPMMKLRLAQPETLIDINGLSELGYIGVAGGELRIGALTRHAQLLDSAPAGEQFAILHDAERVIADPIVRNWGTIGGSLCQADPSEDLSAAFAALKATMVIRGPDGSRTVPAREFHTGPYETVVGARRDADRDPDPDPARRRQRLREGRAPGRGLAGRRGRRGALAATATDRRGRDRPDRRRRAALRRRRGRGVPARRARPPRRASPGRPDRRRALPPSSDQRGPADYKRHLAGELTIRALRRRGAGPRRRGPRGAA